MRTKVLLAAGVVGPCLFTLVWLVEESLRPDYHSIRNWISELSLTGRGWIQIASFLVSGALIIAFSRGLRATNINGLASRWGPRLIAITGVALCAAGVFVIDPGLGYPPGTAASMSWHGMLHQVAGLVVFLSLALAAIAYSRRSARAYCLTSGITVILLWVLAGTLAGLDYAGTWTPAPAGLAERLAILTAFGWMVWLAIVEHRRIRVADDREA